MIFSFYKTGNDWYGYLHKLRRKEIDIAFSEYEEKQFDIGLELGAGDGYQSKFLVKFVDHLVCTELDETRLKKIQHPAISYKVCDAEKIDAYFSPKSFDLIFSSNMFEHLLNPMAALSGIKKVLKDSGITILIMPSPFWAVNRILFYHSGLTIRQLRKFSSRKWVNSRINERLISVSESSNYSDRKNNLKGTHSPPHNSILKFLRFPAPHGVSKNNIEELRSFQRIKWIRLFEAAGFRVLKVVKGPIAIPTAGGALDLKLYRSLVEKMGFTSEFIYFLTKAF
jgi:SAM-dependent methyltransferase